MPVILVSLTVVVIGLFSLTCLDVVPLSQIRLTILCCMYVSRDIRLRTRWSWDLHSSGMLRGFLFSLDKEFELVSSFYRKYRQNSTVLFSRSVARYVVRDKSDCAVQTSVQLSWQPEHSSVRWLQCHQHPKVKTYRYQSSPTETILSASSKAKPP